MAGMFRELRADEIECRVSRIVQTKQKLGVVLLLYTDARTCSDVLDEAVGPECWQDKYYECKGNLYCSVGINVSHGDTSEWIWKDDCGSESNMEKAKGEASDAFKRACYRWGVAKELYTAPFIWINDKDCKHLYQDNNGTWKCIDKFYVRLVDYENGAISKLAVENQDHEIVFTFGDMR